ncbi:phage polarity suppression protein [Raoultella ornithinolytica]|uniref:phage polarity suppression protein n=1 Tax=Raoultella ornithinolytica TaxID=54291 RepID=UPI003672EA2D
MTTLTLQQAFDACQTNKTAWLNCKAELTAAEQEYQELLLDDNASGSRRLQTLRDIIDVKKWEINQAAGRYFRAHENVQHISIRNRLNDFMQAHGAELAAALAPELMDYNNRHPAVTRSAMQHSVGYLREALSVWLAAGEKINYSAQDNDILTAIGFRPDAASRDDNREKYTPAQNQNYVNKRAELAAQQTVRKSP